ncbi:BTB/POZ domain and ankyrin repeat-containing protein NPR1-like [Citrus sinensis]|uniref:BTB/POZ domain and ankyrin repeat-containing protein NPR1-like n=1 Tax=Citrus sinensis TaxID=2711 RepID=UPI002278A9E6|nr:BTB/POZ domain and ankyrin repeat-containing protein NPR1-like [Citrus sinensis]
MSLYFVFWSDLRTGRRYFPRTRCSEVVDKFLDCDWSDASFLEKGTPEEQKLKRTRFMELKEDVKKAFYKDMAEKNRSGLSSSTSSSSSPKEGETKRVLLSLIVTCGEILLEPMLWLCCKIAEELQACIVVFSQVSLSYIVIPILVAAFHCQLNQLRSPCIQRVECEANIAEVDPMHATRVRGIHEALDSYDFELLKLLLDESNVTLDDAYALHYAAAYCSPKVFKEVLNMDSAGLNLKDARGHTVLHVAARRKEPAVLVTLLSKGGCASETTSDGQTAVAICRRMTRRKDYIEATKQGQETNKDRLCIDVLEREMRRNSMSGNLALSSEVMADDFQMKLNYLENRVSFARCLFPSEAIIAMDIADADATNFCTGLSASKSKGSSGNLKEVDLNETPSMQAKRLAFTELSMIAVETGRRYFPHSSKVIEEFMNCDWSDASLLEFGTPEAQKLKRACFHVRKAFCQDMASDNRSGPSSSSSAFFVP